MATNRFATKENLKTIVDTLRDEYSNLVSGSVDYDDVTVKVDSSDKLYVPVDTALSATSTNPVQNCIVTRPLQSVLGRLGVLADVVPDDWSTLAAAIAAGDGESVLPVGSQIRSPWTITNGSIT